MKLSLLVPLMATAVLAACTPFGDGPTNSLYNNTSILQEDLGSLTYRATEALIHRGKQSLDSQNPVLVASIANVDDLRQSSTFGRLIGEQASSRLAQLGHVVRDVRLTDTLVVREGTGELILSRGIQKISQDYKAQAIVAGTYAVGGSWIYVNLRLINAITGRIVSAVDFVVPLDGDTRRLLITKAIAPAPKLAVATTPKPRESYMVYFAHDSASLDDAGRATIAEVVQALQAQNAGASIIGHTDTLGTDNYNLSLSQQRAKAISDELLKAGIRPSVIITEGRGERDLAMPTADNVGEPRNRRAIINIR